MWDDHLPMQMRPVWRLFHIKREAWPMEPSKHQSHQALLQWELIWISPSSIYLRRFSGFNPVLLVFVLPCRCVHVGNSFAPVRHLILGISIRFWWKRIYTYGRGQVTNAYRKIIPLPAISRASATLPYFASVDKQAVEPYHFMETIFSSGDIGAPLLIRVL